MQRGSKERHTVGIGEAMIRRAVVRARDGSAAGPRRPLTTQTRDIDPPHRRQRLRGACQV
jgi:hypothetical protein